jgi:hypothetical protein
MEKGNAMDKYATEKEEGIVDENRELHGNQSNVIDEFIFFFLFGKHD